MTLKFVLVSISVAGSASEISQCKDIEADDEAVSTCWQNFQWAKETGFSEHPDWYNVYDVAVDSPTPIWQCALYLKANEEGSTAGHEDNYPSRDHNCPYPCTTSLKCPLRTTVAPTLPPLASVTEAPPPETSEVQVTITDAPITTTEEAPSSSIPTWMIGVCIVGLLVIVAIPAFLLNSSDKKQKSPKKKKRGVKKEPREAEKEESVPLASATEPEPELAQPLQPVPMYTHMPMTGPSESFVMSPAYHTTAMPMTTAVPTVAAPAGMPLTTAYPQHMPVPFVQMAQAPAQAMPAQAMPAQAMPAQAMHVQAMPVQAMPAQSVHGGSMAVAAATNVVAPSNMLFPAEPVNYMTR